MEVAQDAGMQWPLPGISMGTRGLDAATWQSRPGPYVVQTLLLVLDVLLGATRMRGWDRGEGGGEGHFPSAFLRGLSDFGTL